MTAKLNPAGKGAVHKLSRRLLAEVKEAWNEDRYPGPWRGDDVAVHDHPPPFCWGRSDKDCTKRVVEMLDAGMSARDVATLGGMTFNALNQRLRAKGIRYVRSTGTTPAQRRVMQRLRDFGMTLADISALLRDVTGQDVSLNSVAYHTHNPRLTRCQVTLTVATETVDRLNKLAQEVNLTPGRALDALLLQQALDDDDGGRDDGGEDEAN